MIKAKINITSSSSSLSKQTIVLPSLRTKAITINACNSFIFDNITIVENVNTESYKPFAYGFQILARSFLPNQIVGLIRTTLDNITLSYNGFIVVFPMY